MTGINLKQKLHIDVKIKGNIYLYGRDATDPGFYSIYLGKDYSFNTLKKWMKSLEGYFASEMDLKNDYKGMQSCPVNKNNCSLNDFEQKYKGKFFPFEK